MLLVELDNKVFIFYTITYFLATLGRSGFVSAGAGYGSPNPIRGPSYVRGQGVNTIGQQSIFFYFTIIPFLVTLGYSGIGSFSGVGQGTVNPIRGSNFGSSSAVGTPNPIRGSGFAHGLGIANRYQRKIFLMEFLDVFIEHPKTY